ncbi:hypothetical protein DFJ74DRAFT_680561 [Hyaloraphidium curvatum]|nr:hypothetical protein DFJ74DRAFT_680561 [Hyaloraphidium curvatum]
MHSSVVELAEKDVEYQAFLSEIVVENVEEQHGLALSRDFAFPKMRAKGVVGKITVAPPSSSKPASKPAPKPSPASPPSGPRIVELEDDEPPKTAKGKEPAQPKSILKPTAPPPPADKGEPAREKVAEKQPAAKPAVAEKIAEREPPKAVAGTIREREAPKAVAETIREREPPRPALDRAGEPERPPTAPIAATRPPPPANGINGHAGPPAEAAPAPEEPRHIVRVTGTAPKRMVAVEIELPGMTTLASAALDVSRDAIAFEVPEKYRLRVKLPVSVDFADEAKGRAVFDRSAKKLVVTLEESE